jgi:uncharacterized protein YcnI
VEATVFVALRLPHFWAHMASSRFAVAAVGAVVALASLASLASRASANVTATPGPVSANTVATIGFTVNFGCGLWPTTDLKIDAPAAVTDLRVVEKPGWVTTTTGSTAEFSDGLLDAQTSDTFQVTFTVPDEPGTVLMFPVEQTCIDGQEVDWNAGPHASPSANLAPTVTIEAQSGPPARSTPPPAAAAASRPSRSNPLLFLAAVPVVVPLAAAGWWLTGRRPSQPRSPKTDLSADRTTDEAGDDGQQSKM